MVPHRSFSRHPVNATVSLLHSETGELAGGMRITGAASGRGGQTPLRVHFGLPAPGPPSADPKYSLRVQVPYADEPVMWTEFTMSQAAQGTLRHYHERDADGDGISNAQEIIAARGLGTNANDIDQDGTPNWLDTDSDGDGFLDSFEAGDTDLCTPPVDLDNNGIADFLEFNQESLVSSPFLEGSGCTCVLTRTSRRPFATLLVLIALASLVVRRRRR